MHSADDILSALARSAVNALVLEVSITPKPGLVDCHNSGSHSDMDYFTFLHSAHSLYPYFKSCCAVGYNGSIRGSQLFLALRPLGVEAEHTMFDATGGVNTHKGAIYSFGLLCASAGRLLLEGVSLSAQAICQYAAYIAQKALAQHCWNQNAPHTAGERAYADYGLTGIRGEAASGFSSVQTISMPVFCSRLAVGYSINLAAVTSLLHLIAHVQDTNMIKRGGRAQMLYIQEQLGRRLRRRDLSLEEISDLDQAFIARNLSPGGCADLLAITLFLWMVDYKIWTSESVLHPCSVLIKSSRSADAHIEKENHLFSSTPLGVDSSSRRTKTAPTEKDLLATGSFLN